MANSCVRLGNDSLSFQLRQLFPQVPDLANARATLRVLLEISQFLEFLAVSKYSHAQPEDALLMS
jgi:hypothetical protein